MGTFRTKDYSFQRIVPLFKDVDENMLDVEQAKRMIKELWDYIYEGMQRTSESLGGRNEERTGEYVSDRNQPISKYGVFGNILSSTETRREFRAGMER